MIVNSIYDTEVVDDSGILCVMDADFYAPFAEHLAIQSDFMPCLIDAMNSSTGIFWGTGSEEIWRIQIREGLSSEEGFRSFMSLLQIRSGNLILAELGEFLGGANDPLYFPHRLTAVVTKFTPGGYLCKIIQMFDHEDRDNNFAARALDFVIEIEAAAEPIPQQPRDSIPGGDKLICMGEKPDTVFFFEGTPPRDRIVETLVASSPLWLDPPRERVLLNYEEERGLG